MDSWVDYYEELEISRHASDETIKAAYRALCRKYHPDMYRGDTAYANARIKRIYEAYQTLSDTEAKRAYDAAYDYRNRQQPFAKAKASNPDPKPSQSPPADFSKKEPPRKERRIKWSRIIISLLAVIAAVEVFLLIQRDKDIDYLATIRVCDSTDTVFYGIAQTRVENGHRKLINIMMPTGKNIPVDLYIKDAKAAIEVVYEDSNLRTKRHPFDSVVLELQLNEELKEESSERMHTNFEMQFKTPSSGKNVCASKNSDICHVLSCPYAKNIADGNILYFRSKEVASILGFSNTCSRCREMEPNRSAIDDLLSGALG